MLLCHGRENILLPPSVRDQACGHWPARLPLASPRHPPSPQSKRPQCSPRPELLHQPGPPRPAGTSAAPGGRDQPPEAHGRRAHSHLFEPVLGFPLVSVAPERSLVGQLKRALGPQRPSWKRLSGPGPCGLRRGPDGRGSNQRPFKALGSGAEGPRPRLTQSSAVAGRAGKPLAFYEQPPRL